MLLGLYAPEGHRENEIEARRRREYPAAAVELEATANHVIAKGTLFSHELNRRETVTNELMFAAAGDKKVLVRDGRVSQAPPPKKPLPASVLCKTPEYLFELERRSPTDPYVLLKHSGTFDHALDFDYDYDFVGRCATVYEQRSLLHRLRHASFKVTAARSVLEGPSELVEIEYTYDGEECSESGAVYLDPQLKWGIRKVDMVIQGKRLMAKKHARSRSTSRARWNTRMLETVYTSPKGWRISQVPTAQTYSSRCAMELTDITMGDAPERLFKLSGYGLPDVPLRPVRQPSAFSWRNPVTWISLTMAVVSIALLRVTRRKRGSAAAQFRTN